MNKKLLVIGLLLPLLAGCDLSKEYVSPVPFVPNPDSGGEEGGGGGGEVDPPGPEEFNLTVYFFLDYSHSEVYEDAETGALLPGHPTNAIYKMEWYALEPLGKMPEEATITDSMAADPHFNHFIGYSRYSTCLDEGQLWDWSNDYETKNVLNLYGIWVHKD